MKLLKILLEFGEEDGWTHFVEIPITPKKQEELTHYTHLTYKQWVGKLKK